MRYMPIGHRKANRLYELSIVLRNGATRKLGSSLILRIFMGLNIVIRKKTDTNTDPSPKNK